MAGVMQKNIVDVGGITYTAEEKLFAEKIQASLGFQVPPVTLAEKIRPLERVSNLSMGSTDVGDVSWNVPTVGMIAATWVPGTPAHSWQAVACGGTEIGTKAMMIAARAMTLTAIDLFHDNNVIQRAKAEFEKAKGNDFHYTPLLGDRKPALNYRD